MKIFPALQEREQRLEQKTYEERIWINIVALASGDTKLGHVFAASYRMAPAEKIMF